MCTGDQHPARRESVKERGSRTNLGTTWLSSKCAALRIGPRAQLIGATGVIVGALKELTHWRRTNQNTLHLG